MPFHPVFRRLIERRETLTRAEAAELSGAMLRGEASEAEIAAVLTAMAMRGETAEEIAGFVDTVRLEAIAVPLEAGERELLVDTCGTGADQSGTFNISTGAALVAAAAGATVAKHGNRAVTSACGSGDVLEALGVPVGMTPEQAAASLRRHRFAYLHAPSLHPAMRFIGPVRRALGVRTIFHVVNPLANPAGAQAQVMGVHSAALVKTVAQAMVLLETRHGFVVHGDGMDELSICGPSHVAEVRDGGVALRMLDARTLGLEQVTVEALQGGGAVQNTAILRGIFAGGRGAARDVVALNAAAILVAADLAEDLPAGLLLAGRAIDSGAVAALVAALQAD